MEIMCKTFQTLASAEVKLAKPVHMHQSTNDHIIIIIMIIIMTVMIYSNFCNIFS